MTLGRRSTGRNKDSIPRLPPRQPDAHKGDFGRVLVVGGSRGMSGAAAMAGMAALRGGAGLVRVAVPASVLPIVASYAPEYMTLAMPEDDDGRFSAAAAELLERSIPAATVVALGPGIGQSEELDDLVAHLYSSVTLPMVVDAEALNALARRQLAAGAPAGPRVLTPHPGEFLRIAHLDNPVERPKLERSVLEQKAIELAAHLQAVIVLKGQHSLVTDGKRAEHNETGNPGMATGGSGDVLTGIIAALLAQKMEPFEAARLGAHLHGLAGDLAADNLGQVAMKAGDLIDYLPAALRKLGM
ncbi:MAG TPA: NAD(P)H-hydrate dehydratase [Pirellulales bacterium]|nr:NAD(P)H-hydrate dehydratase [Pirellulales bacterium]